MSNLVTLPTMRFRRAPETRNLFATRRLYIYYHCQFYRSVSTSSTRFHRGKSCYRCYNRPSPYPKVTSKQQTLPPSVFIDSCRGNDTLYFPLSPHHRFDESCCRANGIFLTVRVFEKQVVGPARRESRWIGLDSISSTRKNGEEEKKRRERERRVLRGGAKQFDSHPGPRDFGDAKLPVTAFREKRSCKEKLRRERIKKGRSWLPSPSASEPYFLFSPSLERARHLFFGQVKLSFISTGRNEAPQKGEETTVAR